MASKFYEDKRKEELFGKWLDKNFYPNFNQIGGKKILTIVRNDNESLQKKGVDVIANTSQGEKIYIDEKAALHYINKNIPTFSFEIMNVTSKAMGWLYNPNYITDYYLLAWPNAHDESVPDEYAFTTSEVMVIRRENVIQLLEEKGLNPQSIKEHICKYYNRREQDNNIQIVDGVKLNFNLTLHEQPINLIISKRLLYQYKDFSGMIPQ